MITREEYAEKISAMKDEALIEEVDRQVWLSAFANNNPRAPAHWKTDALYGEAKRRDAPWIYQSGYNKAYQGCGYELSAEEIERAKHPVYRTPACGCPPEKFCKVCDPKLHADTLTACEKIIARTPAGSDEARPDAGEQSQ